ncbi:PAS domain S-box protein [Phormidium sp. LEGE 05292]|uniref:PAS domain S-box protein n=1 Tax=[Phormidium] sp. LEGE 05292 TaxID=767427 RepID=UPI001881BCE0|nr:PAS domain S-box protein [Phormidium sp. LEGE 05292]MBE9228681.1 PAS domain S-box protein [Phormidium sp. LEGE 05292]
MKYRAYRLLLPYVVAIASTGIALLLTLGIEPLMTQTSCAFFYIAVIVSTWYGGIYLGIVTVVLSVLAIQYFLFPPIYHRIPIFDDLLRLSTLTIVALIINLLSANLKESKRKVEQLSRKLQQESGERLKTALNAAQMGMWDWDRVTGKITWSPEYEILLGLTPGTFDGRYETFDVCVYTEDRKGLTQTIKKCLKNRIPYQREFRVVWADGSVHWIEGWGKAFYNEQGKVIRMSGTIMAIDSRKQTEIALQESQNQIQRQLTEIETIYHSAPIGLNVLDTELRFVRINQRLAEMNGLSVEAHIGRTIRELLPDLADTTERLLRPILETGEPLFNVEITGETPAQPGVKRIWLESFLPLRDGEQIIGINTVCEEITERKQAEQDLARAALRIQTLFHTSFDGIVTLDRQGNVLDANPRFAEMLGYTPEEIAQMNAVDWDAQLNPEKLQQFLDNSIKLKNGVIETRHRRKDGSIYDVEISYSVIQWQEDILRFCVCRDITERTQTQLTLQQLNAELEARVAERTAELTLVNDRLLKALLEQQKTQFMLLEKAKLLDLAHDTIMTLDLNLVITFWNQGAQRMYGWTEAEALGKKSYILLKTQFPQPLTEIKAQVLEQGYWEGELTNCDRNNQCLIVASRWIVQKDEMGRPIKILKINNNITARKQAELALQKNAQEIEDLYNNAPCGYHSLDSDGLIIRINDTELNWLGYSREEILHKKKFVDLIVPESKHIFEQNFHKFKQQGCLDNLECEMLNKDGTTRWVNVNATAIRDRDGNFFMTRSSLFDITERKRMEEALRQSEQMFRSVSEFSPIGIFLCDVTGKFIYTNTRYQQIVAASMEETLGDSWKEFIHPDDREWAFQYWSDLVSTGNEGVFNELRYQDRQGRVCYTQVRTAPIKSRDGKTILFVGVMEDITEQRKIDQMKKDFISVVSHELRTPLTSIRGSLGLVAGGVYDKKPEKMKEMIAIAARQSDRLVRLVNDILDLRRLESGQTKFNFRWCAAADFIKQSVDVMRTQAEQNQIKLCIVPSLVEVWADADAMVQTLTNLLSNAIKFSPPNSTITISTKVIPEHLLTQKQLPSSVLFSVKDRGRGIPQDKLESIFAQFQQVDASDAREKGGTGLGLAICRNIIEQHGGKIWVESVLNEGSTFYFTLPCWNVRKI